MNRDFAQLYHSSSSTLVQDPIETLDDVTSHYSRHTILSLLNSEISNEIDISAQTRVFLPQWISTLSASSLLHSGYNRFLFTFYNLSFRVICKYSLVDSMEAISDALFSLGSRIQQQSEISSDLINCVCAILASIGSCCNVSALKMGISKKKLADAVLSLLNDSIRKERFDGSFFLQSTDYISAMAMLALRALLPEFFSQSLIEQPATLNFGDLATDAQMIAVSVLSHNTDTLVNMAALELLTRTSFIIQTSRNNIVSILREQLQNVLGRLRKQRIDNIRTDLSQVSDKSDIFLLRTILSCLIQVTISFSSETMSIKFAVDNQIITFSLQSLRISLLEEGASGFSRMVRNQRRNGGVPSSISKLQTFETPMKLSKNNLISNFGRNRASSSDLRSPLFSTALPTNDSLTEDARSVLTGGICAFMSIELGAILGSDEPSTGTFNSSSSAATIYELLRELVAAREMSLSQNTARWTYSGASSALSRLNLDTTTVDNDTSVISKQRAIDYCSNLISLILHVTISCDSKNITSIVSSSLLEIWVLEREVICNNDSRSKQRLGLPRFQLGGQKFLSKTDDELSGYFSNTFGSSLNLQGDSIVVFKTTESSPKTFLGILLSSLTSSSSSFRGTSSEDRSQFFCTIISALGRLCILKSSGTRSTGAYADASEILIAHFIQQASRIGSSTDASNIIDPVALVLCGHQASIALSLGVISKGLLQLTRENTCKTDQIETESKRKDFRKRMLNLAIQLGAEANRVGIDPNETYSSLLGAILPALAYSLIPSYVLSDKNTVTENKKNYSPPIVQPHLSTFIQQRSSASSVRMYRSLWLTLIAHHFFDDGLTSQPPGRQWPSIWLRSIRSIARHTPVLVARSLSGSKPSIDTDLSTGGANTIFPFSNNVMTEIRAQLVSLMPTTARAGLASLPMHQIVFLRSVYALETLRASSGSCMASLLYLQDQTIEQEGLSGFMESIAASAFSSFSTYAHRLGSCPQREILLVDHAQFFLANCAHRFSSVRSIAFKLIVDLADNFPSLLWNESIVRVLLDTVEILSNRAKQGDYPPQSNGFFISHPKAGNTNNILLSDPLAESASIRAPTSSFDMHVPSSMAELADVLCDITELASHWILRALASAPNETRSLFLRYLGQISGSNARIPHAGLSLALYGVAPSLTSSYSGPIIKPFGMSLRVRNAALGTIGRVAPSLSLELGLLSASDVRVRYSSSAGSSSIKRTSLGAKTGGNSSSSATGPQAPSSGNVVEAPPSAPRINGQVTNASFATPSSIRSLGGFYSTAWGVPFLDETHRGRKGLKTSSMVAAIDEFGEDDDSFHDDDDAGDEDESTFASVSNSDRALKLNGIPAVSTRPLNTRSIPRGSGRGSVTGSSVRLTTSSKMLHSSNTVRGFGSLMAIASSGLSSEFERVSIRVAIDPLSMLGSRLAPTFVASAERKSHFLGQIEGMASFHSQFIVDGNIESPDTKFEDALTRMLIGNAHILLVTAHLEWRSKIIALFESSILPENQAYDLFGTDVINDIIGIIPLSIEVQPSIFQSVSVQNESEIKMSHESFNVQPTGIEISSSTLGHTLYRISAFIVWTQSNLDKSKQKTPDYIEKLMSLLVWIPVRVFSAEALSIAVECWSWVLSSSSCSRSSQMRLLDHILSSWKWTISMKLGLFSGTSLQKHSPKGVCEPPTSCVGSVRLDSIQPGSSTSLQPTVILPPGLCSTEPHRIFISFLEERFKVSRTTNVEELAMINSAVVFASNFHAASLSMNPSAFGAHIRLVHLELCVLQAAQGASLRTLPRSMIRSMRTRGQVSSQQHSDTLLGLGTVGAAIGASLDHDLSLDLYYRNSSDNVDDDKSDNLDFKVDEFGTPTFSNSNDFQLITQVGAVKPWPIQSVGSLSALRERTYRALLRWFELKPSRYEAATSSERVREDFPFMVAVCRLLKSDIFAATSSTPLDVTEERDNRRPFMSDDITGGDDESEGNLRINLKKEIEVILPSYRYASFRSNKKSLQLNPETNDFATKLISMFCKYENEEQQTKLTRQSNEEHLNGKAMRSFAPSLMATFQELQNIRDLCLILLGHEMDRIVAWHNPLDVDERHLPSEQEFSIEALINASISIGTGDISLSEDKSTTENNLYMWRRIIYTAWSIKPSLALSVAGRFKCIKFITDLVSDLVRNDPDAVLNEPAAIVFIVNEETVRENSPVLQKLSLWTPCSMPIIVTMLARRPLPEKGLLSSETFSRPLFCHPLVTSYVLRCLSQFTDEVIVFFLPQIVQALRHDTSSMLSEFLINLGKRSLLIAEQLIWTLSSECSEGEEESGKQENLTESQLKDNNSKIFEKSHGFQHQLRGSDPLPDISTALSANVLATLSPLARTSVDLRYAFWDQVTNISGRLKTEVPNKSQRRIKVREFLRDLQTESERDFFYARDRLHKKISNEEKKRPLRLAGAVRVLGGRFVKDSTQMTKEDKHVFSTFIFDITLPTNPYLRLVSVDLESGRPMQSAAKCPFRLTFQVEECNGPDDLLRSHERQLALQKDQPNLKTKSHEHSSLSLASSSFIDNSTILRAQLGAQHAALVLRRKVQRKRVEVGETLERTRDIVEEGIRRQKIEIGKGVNSIVSVASHGIALLRSGSERSTDRKEDKQKNESVLFEVPEITTELEESINIIDEDTAHAEADEARHVSDDEDDDIDDSSIIDEKIKDNFGAQFPENTGANADGISSSSSIIDKPDSQIDTSDNHKRQSTLLRDSISSIGRTLKAFHADRSVMKDNSNINDDVNDDEGETYQNDKTISKITSCIFKVFDDCRQDALALQFMALCKETFDESNLGLSLFPYRVVPTRTGASKIPGGILECVPDVRSRDEIGKSGFKSLFDFYISTFGRPDGSDFESARRNLIRSLAAYAVFCYLLRVKDRHNGNLLVSGQGHLVHIDFGFLLGISPGGNLGFETAAFKLTQEMVDIMGGSVDSEAFQIFSELSCRAFLLARDKIEELNSLVIGMADSALPCFLFPDTLLNLRSRFQPKDTDMKACKFWRAETIASAKSVTTTLYDGIQKLQQGIAY
jgi:hypothetical protein